MNISGKYMKVWKVEEKNGFTKLNLGDSKKAKDGTYTNWTWFGCTLLGNAKQVTVDEGDTIEIKSGIISQRKYNEKYYNDIIIFELEVMKKAESNESREKRIDNSTDFEDDIPF